MTTTQLTTTQLTGTQVTRTQVTRTQVTTTQIALAFLACIAMRALPVASAQSLDAQTGLVQGPLSSQQSAQQQQQPSVNHPAMNDTQDSAPNSGISGQMMKDKIFLRKAAQGGLAEVQLGQLASGKASTQDVKDFGSKMVTDHTALNDEMKPIADSMGVMLPKKLNPKDQAEFDKLNALSGDDFDREYITFMVKDHHEDLHEFRMEAATTTDPTLKAAVEKGTKIIREHATMVDALARSKGIQTPTHGQHQAPPPAQQ